MANNPVKDALRALRPDIEKALDEIAKKHGLKSLRTGNASYTHEGAFTMKIEGVLGGGLSKEESFYDEMAGMYGLPPRGTVFHYGVGPTFREYTIVGTNATGSKIIVTRTNKPGLFLIPVDLVKRFATATAKAAA